MAELKAVTVIGVIQDIFETPYGEFYFRKEADAVIRHHKYKRCLAWSQWCMDAKCETEKDAKFLVRWEHRWLTLAEHFKEGK